MTSGRDMAGADGHCGDLRKPEGLPGGGQVRGGGAAAALASSTGRGACAIRGSNSLKWWAIGLV
ncbi:MAG: hypothetical protein AB1403_06280 [Candidatus Riflebacteria bacterium]